MVGDADGQRKKAEHGKVYCPMVGDADGRRKKAEHGKVY